MSGEHDQPINRPRGGPVFSWLAHRWRACISRRGRPRATLRATHDGFEVLVHGAVEWSLRWEDVAAVVAFKRDIVTIDLICLGFALRDKPGPLWCIDEDMDGFRSIEDGIERVTAGAWPAGFSRVALPPFAENWTVLWSRPGTAAMLDNPSLVWLARDADPSSVQSG